MCNKNILLCEGGRERERETPQGMLGDSDLDALREAIDAPKERILSPSRILWYPMLQELHYLTIISPNNIYPSTIIMPNIAYMFIHALL